MQSTQIVTGGAVTLDKPALSVEIGLPYTHVVEPLPPSAVGAAGGGRKVRLVRGLFRLQDTQALRLDTGRGLKDIPLRQIGEDEILDAPPPAVSGDILTRALGWLPDGTKALWRIEQDIPLAFTLLSVSAEIKVND